MKTFGVVFLGSTIARLAFFNLALNYFRGLPIGYQSSTTTSITDKALHWIEAHLIPFFKDYYLDFICIAVFIAFLFFA